jgi:hypothetical protein
MDFLLVGMDLRVLLKYISLICYLVIFLESLEQAGIKQA